MCCCFVYCRYAACCCRVNQPIYASFGRHLLRTLKASRNLIIIWIILQYKLNIDTALSTYRMYWFM